MFGFKKRVFLMFLIPVFLCGIVWAGSQMRNKVQSIFTKSKTSIRLCDKILVKTRQIKSKSEIIRNLTAPKNKKNKKDIRKIKEQVKTLNQNMAELVSLSGDLDSLVSKINKIFASIRVNKCPPGHHWVPGYKTPQGKHIPGHCKPN